MKIFLFIFVIFTIFLIPDAFAICNEGQVDINSASIVELDKLSGIGEVRAEAIIDARPFNNIDELIDVIGIGEVTLSKIKTQGLACVVNEKYSEESEEDEEEEDNEDNENQEEEEDSQDEEKSEDESPEIIAQQKENTQEVKAVEEVKTIVLEPLNTNTKTIKSKNYSENLDKNKLANYGLILISLILAFLLIRKNKNEKSEFR